MNRTPKPPRNPFAPAKPSKPIRIIESDLARAERNLRRYRFTTYGLMLLVIVLLGVIAAMDFELINF